MPLNAIVALAATAAVVSVGMYHVAFVAPRLRSLAALLAVEDGEAASLAVVRGAAAHFAKVTNGRLERLESIVARDLVRVGFVRYNSFSDVGSDQSFSLALVNEAGDGVVVSSIFGREETRTYGKAVRAFHPVKGASQEEEAAIAIARGREGAVLRA